VVDPEAVGYTGAVAVGAAGRHDGPIVATSQTNARRAQLRPSGKGDAVGAKLPQSIRGLDFGSEPVEIGDIRFVRPELHILE
jgi:hypothetical protein